MPTIPTYQSGDTPQTVRNVVPRANGADPIAAGLAGIERGMNNLASDVDLQARRRDHEAKILRQAEEKQAEERAKVYAGQQSGQSMLNELQAMEEARRKAPPGADGFAKEYLKGFDERAAEALKNAPDEPSKKFLQQHQIAQRTHFGAQAEEFQFKAGDADVLERFKGSVDTWGKVVQQDPTQFNAATKTIAATMPDITPDKRPLLVEHATTMLTNAAASHWMDRDPYKVQDATSKALGFNGFKGPTGVPWVDKATPDQVKTWNNQAATKIAQIESQMARDGQVREKEAQDLFGQATDLTFKGQYFSSAFQTQLLTAAKGTRYEAGALELIDSQRQTAGFASAPADQRTAALNTMRSRGADPAQGTSPGMAKELTKIEGIDASIRTEVDKNPWVAAQTYAVVKDAALVPIASADDAIKTIQGRAAAQGSVEAWAGKAISPLQPAEANQLSDVLSSMTPQARGVALAQIGSHLPLPRLEALATQLDSKDKAQALALKFTENTSAGRPLADLILRGDQSIKDKTIKKDDAALTGWRSEIAKMVRGTMGPQGEKVENDIINAAYYVRAAMENEGNAVPGYKLGASEKEAVKFVMGEPIERNGVKTFLPRSMDESAFDKALSSYTPETLKGVAPEGLFLRGQPITLDRFSSSISRYGMTRDGKGNFIPSSGGAFITTDKDGTRPLRLPVSASQ